MQYIVDCIVQNSDHKLRDNTSTKRGPNIEFSTTPDDILMNPQHPRLLSTHMYFDALRDFVLNDKVKVIYIKRDPKDVLVSYYHFYKMNKSLGRFTGSWDEFFAMYRKRQLCNGDVFDYNEGWWSQREKENVFCTSYEQMKSDSCGIIKAIGLFLGVTLSDDVISQIAKETSFEEMSLNPNVNGEHVEKRTGVFDLSISKFIRKGKVGDWKNYFSEEQLDYMKEQFSKSTVPYWIN